MLAKSRGHLTAFVIGRVGRDQAGVYECKAENEEGKVMAVTQLFVQCQSFYFTRFSLKNTREFFLSV